MSSSTETEGVEELGAACAGLVLDTEKGIVIENDALAEPSIDFRWCLVGKFVTEKNVHFISMKNMLAALWRPVKGVIIRDLGSNRYLFQFFHEIDISRVIEGGPWTFEQNLLITRRLKNDEHPLEVPLNMVDVWVQVHNLPIGFMSERVAQAIGNYMGVFIKADRNNFTGTWRNYMQVCVSIDSTKALQQKMKLKREGGNWFWAEYKYERIRHFCFICGKIGHHESTCEKLFNSVSGEVEWSYGTWMIAGNNRSGTNIGARWLREEPPPKLNESRVDPLTDMQVDFGKANYAPCPKVMTKLHAVNDEDFIQRDSYVSRNGKEVGEGYKERGESDFSDMGTEDHGVTITSVKRARQDLGVSNTVNSSRLAHVHDDSVVLNQDILVGPGHQARQQQ